ncbi:phosphotransferase family protein [Planococcus salinus]|uniref:Phosphotransferase family protein n=2 Tax=Planococcus salinus TaxID=1848460 RepID=A0A3M8P9I7_9BACL|nr:phosphotransferase family protein [Planococcus salinus]
MHRKIKNLPEMKMEVQKFSEGFSNLTFLIRFGEWEAVLRRAPSGYVPPKAHDMHREYMILRKVNPVFPVAPKPYLYCDDSDIMDKPFYVMEKKQGVVIDGALPEKYPNTKETKQQISSEVVRTLVELHSIDYKKASMDEMGRPEGFLERQIHGWIKRYNLSKTEDLNFIDEVEKWLINNLPSTKETTIVHNDFKLNNMVFDTEDPRQITGILDWELSTVGDPLTDLASALVCWGEEGDPPIGIAMITNQPGFYSRRDFLNDYAQQSGRDVSNIHYYLTFGFYKLAVIQQQLYYRWKIGEIDDPRLETLKESIYNLMKLADNARFQQV